MICFKKILQQLTQNYKKKASAALFAISINDGFVHNLSCSDLKVEKIYSAINQDVFNSSNHIPIKNWSFRSGLYDIAGCWSLSHAQKIFFYLGRNSPYTTHNRPLTQQLNDIFDLIRGSSPYLDLDKGIQEFPLNNYKVFNFQFNDLLFDYEQKMIDGSIYIRNFHNEIEFYQTKRFHSPDNIKYVLKDGPRSVRENQATIDYLKKNLAANKVTTLLIRPLIISQHVVLAKRFYQINPKRIRFDVYDSNHPKIDNYMDYDLVKNQFYAPEIITGLPAIKDPEAPVGVFIVDEKENQYINKALLNFYTKACKNLN